MTKALEVNDKPAQNQECKKGQQSGEKRNKQKLQGKALQVNEDTTEGQEAAKSPAPPRRG